MGKRFYDTELFNKQWFRKLKPKHKSFWLYVLCSCDIAGILELDIEASEFFIGEKITTNDVDEIFKNQLLKIDQKRYLVRDFVEFQNGNNLNPKSPVHLKIINILDKHRLWDRVSNRVSNRVCNTPVVVVEVGVIVEEIVGVEVLVKSEKPKTELIFPFDSESFMMAWGNLLKSKKWKNKSDTSLQMSLKKLSNECEADAIKMIENAIVGEWQGLFELKQNEKHGNQQQNSIIKKSVDDKRNEVITMASAAVSRLANLSGTNNQTSDCI